MENASKALLIAASLFFAIMILSLLVMLYNQISSLYNQQSQQKIEQQLIEFNKKFENYDQREIRGSDLVSIMNMIIDYNTREANGKEYPRLDLEIYLGTADNLKEYSYDGTNYLITSSNIDENQISVFSTTTSNLINNLSTAGINNVTESKLQQLAANIRVVLNSDTDKINQILKTNLTTTDSAEISSIQTATKTYYEFTQFKRAHFMCTTATGGTGLTYDKNTGRIVKMTFRVLTTETGNIQFDGTI